MKNGKQVLAYMRSVKIATEKDELAIESYLSRHGIHVKLNNCKASAEDLPAVTLEDFATWFTGNSPQRNDVIVLESSGLIGIVKGFHVNTIILGAALSTVDNALATGVKLETEAYREATTDENLLLQKALNQKGLVWNKDNSKLSEAIRPQVHHYLRVSLLGERLAIGVFREINDAGEIVMYCVKENDKPVRYSLYEPVGKVADYQLEPVSAQERQLLTMELEQAGKIWNGFAGRIEPVDFRAKKGELYFYIDDFLGVTATVEKEKPKDLKRMRSGNYFRNRSDAEEMIAVIEEHRKKQLVHFSKKENVKNVQKRKKTA